MTHQLGSDHISKRSNHYIETLAVNGYLKKQAGTINQDNQDKPQTRNIQTLATSGKTILSHSAAAEQRFHNTYGMEQKVIPLNQNRSKTIQPLPKVIRIKPQASSTARQQITPIRDDFGRSAKVNISKIYSKLLTQYVQQKSDFVDDLSRHSPRGFQSAKPMNMMAFQGNLTSTSNSIIKKQADHAEKQIGKMPAQYQSQIVDDYSLDKAPSPVFGGSHNMSEPRAKSHIETQNKLTDLQQQQNRYQLQQLRMKSPMTQRLPNLTTAEKSGHILVKEKQQQDINNLVFQKKQMKQNNKPIQLQPIYGACSNAATTTAEVGQVQSTSRSPLQAINKSVMDVETVSAQQTRDGTIPLANRSFHCIKECQPSPLAILAQNNLASDLKQKNAQIAKTIMASDITTQQDGTVAKDQTEPTCPIKVTHVDHASQISNYQDKLSEMNSQQQQTDILYSNNQQETQCHVENNSIRAFSNVIRQVQTSQYQQPLPSNGIITNAPNYISTQPNVNVYSLMKQPNNTRQNIRTNVLTGQTKAHSEQRHKYDDLVNLKTMMHENVKAKKLEPPSSSQLAPPAAYLAFEKSLRPVLNKFNQQQNQSLCSQASASSNRQKILIPCQNASQMLMPQQQFSPFIIDCNVTNVKNQKTSPHKPHSNARDHAKLNLKRVADFQEKTVPLVGPAVQHPVILSAEVGLSQIRKSMEKRAQPSMDLPAYTGGNTQNNSTTNIHVKNKSSEEPPWQLVLGKPASLNERQQQLSSKVTSPKSVVSRNKLIVNQTAQDMTSNSSIDRNHKFQQVSDKILERLVTGNKVLDEDQGQIEEKMQVAQVDSSTVNYNESHENEVASETQKDLPEQKDNDNSDEYLEIQEEEIQPKYNAHVQPVLANRGRIKKRKLLARSVISTKPNQRSKSYHNKFKPAEQTSQSQQPALVATNISQAVPAVHNLEYKKFVKMDTRRPDNSRKEERNSLACGSSHLSRTKSQPKIQIKPSRGSVQSSSSAVRSPKPLNVAASSLTMATNNCGERQQLAATQKSQNQQSQIQTSKPKQLEKSELDLNEAEGPLECLQAGLSRSIIPNQQPRNISQPIKKNNPPKQLIINKKDFTAAVASPLMKTENKEKDVIVVGETFKASQVKRVRQIQNSQKTLEIIKQQQNNNQLNEPQSAAQVTTQKNKLQAFSLMSRCASVNSKTINNEPDQSQPSLVENKSSALNQQVIKTEQSAREAARVTPEMIREIVNQQAAARDKERLRPSSISCKMNSVMDSTDVQPAAQAAQQEQFMATIAPKTGSSMQRSGAMKFANDDEYTPSAEKQPYNSCKSYVIIDSHTKKVVQSKNQEEVREMASLTKMMTAIVTLELAQEMNLDIRTTYFKVSLRAAQTTGTTANLVDGQVLSIWDLLHGLMLPSGNDAAMVLAENFSDRIIKRADRSERNQDAANKPLRAPDCNYGTFVKVMNKTARKVSMRNTNYANPHGLADKANHSSALELAFLANYCMKNETFRQIVNTKAFSSVNYLPLKRCKRLPNYAFEEWRKYEDSAIPFPHGEVEYVAYYQTWYNSNKLLDQPGFCGVKTGQTSTAGCCLAIYYQNPVIGKNLVTVVLGSKSIEYRWKDTRRLTLWADAILTQEHEIKMSPTKLPMKRAQLPKFRM